MSLDSELLLGGTAHGRPNGHPSLDADYHNKIGHICDVIIGSSALFVPEVTPFSHFSTVRINGRIHNKISQLFEFQPGKISPKIRTASN